MLCYPVVLDDEEPDALDELAEEPLMLGDWYTDVYEVLERFGELSACVSTCAGVTASSLMVTKSGIAMAKGTGKPWSLPATVSMFVFWLTSNDDGGSVTIWPISEMVPTSFPNLTRILP